MRLCEILNEYESPEIEQKSKWNMHDMKSDSRHGEEGKYSDLEKLGSGGFATEYADKDDPQKVIKGSGRTFMRDGYTAFLEALSKNPKMQSNPYFPHFSNIQIFKNKNKLWPTKAYVVEMERLHKIDTLRQEEQDAMKENLFGEFYQGPKWPVSRIVQHVISQSGEFATPEYVKDKNLIKAEKLVKQISKHNDVQLDLQPSNFRIRRGRFMPQVVIRDQRGTPSGQDWII